MLKLVVNNAPGQKVNQILTHGDLVRDMAEAMKGYPDYEWEIAQKIVSVLVEGGFKELAAMQMTKSIMMSLFGRNILQNPNYKKRFAEIVENPSE